MRIFNGGLFSTFCDSRYAPFLTHFCLAAIVAIEFSLILWVPFWLMLPLCIVTHHRIGVLLHEYMHGIPCRKYSHNLAIFSLVNSIVLTFGILEVFRGTHLAHHRWVNTPRDPGFWVARKGGPDKTLARVPWLIYRTFCGDHGFFLHLKYMLESFRGRHYYVRPKRVVLEIVLSAAWLSFWLLMGLPNVPLTLMLLHLCIVPPAAFRGAVEHSSHPGDPGFANEYRVRLPIFNMNRHIHHHSDPTCPWYLLRFHTAQPLPANHYWTHWFHLFVMRDYEFMRPMQEMTQPYRGIGEAHRQV